MLGKVLQPAWIQALADPKASYPQGCPQKFWVVVKNPRKSSTCTVFGHKAVIFKPAIPQIKAKKGFGSVIRCDLCT